MDFKFTEIFANFSKNVKKKETGSERFRKYTLYSKVKYVVVRHLTILNKHFHRNRNYATLCAMKVQSRGQSMKQKMLKDKSTIEAL